MMETIELYLRIENTGPDLVTLAVGGQRRTVASGRAIEFRMDVPRTIFPCRGLEQLTGPWGVEFAPGEMPTRHQGQSPLRWLRLTHATVDDRSLLVMPLTGHDASIPLAACLREVVPLSLLL